MRVEPFSIALETPLGTATGDITTRDGFLVGLEANGTRGVGEATPLPGWTESADACRRALSEFASIADGDLDRFVDSPAARHAVSLARLDLDARRADLPLAELLCRRHGTRATPAEAVPVNATIGDGAPEDTATAAKNAVEAGYACLKVKVGARDLPTDLDRLRAVRAAVGDDVSLRADANGAWDRETAAEALDALAALDLRYVEQPLPADDLAGHAALCGRGVDIAVDESVTRGDVAVGDLLAMGVADVLVCKPMAMGGPDAVVDAARAAHAAGVTVVVTTTIDAVVARTAALHLAAALPTVRACGLATGSLLATDLADGPTVEKGEIRVPTEPGLHGARFDSLLWTD
ncbi:o-succinylbenzoate synthase [Haloferacaceae archaeon DSL9]